MNQFSMYTFIFLIAILMGVVIFQKINIDNLQEKLSATELNVGDKIENFEAMDIFKNWHPIDVKGVSIIHVMTLSCPVCKNYIPKWNKEFTDKGDTTIYYLVLIEDVGKNQDQLIKDVMLYMVENDVKFPIYIPHAEFANKNHIKGVPMTLNIKDSTVAQIF